MINAIAIDDEAPALKVIENFCGRTEGIRLAGTFLRPRDALTWLAQSPVDLLFLDIRMPSQSGLDLYKTLDPGPLVVFTTAYADWIYNSTEDFGTLMQRSLAEFRQVVRGRTK